MLPTILSACSNADFQGTLDNSFETTNHKNDFPWLTNQQNPNEEIQKTEPKKPNNTPIKPNSNSSTQSPTRVIRSGIPKRPVRNIPLTDGVYPGANYGVNTADEANLGTSGWDPSFFGGDYSKIDELSNTFNYYTLGTEKQTHFYQDELNLPVKDSHYQVANQQIPVNTQFIRYPETNNAVSVGDDGSVSFGGAGYSDLINSTLFPRPAYRINGMIANDYYDSIFKSSVSLYFLNETTQTNPTPDDLQGEKGPGPKYGTGWFLDYKLTNDGSYPIVWYLATNVHVAKNLYNDKSYGKYKQASEHNKLKTQHFRMTRFFGYQKNNNIPDYSGADNDENFSRPPKVIGYNTTPTESNSSVGFDLDHVKLLYMADDFLKTRPHDFSPDIFQESDEEFLDFAVLEVTFKNADDAKFYTNDYANWGDKQWKFRANSYITDPSLWRDPQFYVLGFPYQTDLQIASNKPAYESSLLPVAYSVYNKRKYPDEKIIDQGTPFSNSRWSTSVQGYEGILNPALALKNVPFQIYGKKHYFGGLSYAVRDAGLGAGSSGSMMVNKNREIFAIHHAEWNNGGIGISQALKSERYLYSNLKNYYIPDYDIVHGGGLDQKTSYYQALLEHHSDYKTHLFPNGLQHRSRR
ncbi:MIP family Ig-specific serine endopeptidase [Mycoplasmoides fastidiosum]|uniref:MIP family Ig-specific serine endopeptidase n=1 Tax=Mycoplasmoides fastidiosum TaxID=92758 RepID=UPI0021147665|nr:DUF31 family protein [Mycoplasmoides fastidiosum]UUD37379.1 DUF31 family protein [Mycoplasmoides fastidiosum]